TEIIKGIVYINFREIKSTVAPDICHPDFARFYCSKGFSWLYVIYSICCRKTGKNDGELHGGKRKRSAAR
ncbi:MAG TPA: hypothetical protein VN611_00505, partial [Patescibacteria group bacterium]|nr:hypothetical protein [Patescibacteria group bacterium]